MITNKNGGRQNHCPDFTKLPPKALRLIANCMDEGAISHSDPDGSNWRKISTREHLAHVISHIYKYLDKDTSEEHLINAGTRMLMAIEMEKYNA